MSDFKSKLNYGMAGESAIAKWLRKRGNSVFPAYEKIINNGKGPRIYTPQDLLISPDLLVWKSNNALWIEAKHKTAFSWHRITGRWVTGIDLHHYEHYLKVEEKGPWPVWLLFLHEGGQAKNSPPNSPAGLFGNTLSYLRKNENHRHQNWGKSGMVYWAICHLNKLASIDEINNL